METARASAIEKQVIEEDKREHCYNAARFVKLISNLVVALGVLSVLLVFVGFGIFILYLEIGPPVVSKYRTEYIVYLVCVFIIVIMLIATTFLLFLLLRSIASWLTPVHPVHCVPHSIDLEDTDITTPVDVVVQKDSPRSSTSSLEPSFSTSSLTSFY